MTISKALYTSDSSEWETPQDLFDELNREFEFTLDVCATPQNRKISNFYTKEQDALKQEWHGVCWMNCPYGRQIVSWIQKASDSAKEGATVVCLLPARTDTKWFHEYIWDGLTHKPRTGVEVRLLKGRLKFGGAANSAPFPSMIVIFRGA